MFLQLQAHRLRTPAMAVVRLPSSTFSLTVPLGVSKHFSPHNIRTHSGLSSKTFSAVSRFIPSAFHLHLPSNLVQSSLRRQSTKPIHHSHPQKQSYLSPLAGAGLALALLASTATIAGGTAFAADFPLLGSSSLQLSEPQNALSLPTWAIHVSSVIEWITAMALVWKYGERPGYESWKGLSWGMVPLLGGAFCACTWHFFYNAESLSVLVALQAALTVIGNFTMCIAAFRIYKSSQGGSETL